MHYKEHAEFSLESFIGGWYMPDDVCDGLIRFFATDTFIRHDGRMTHGKADKTIKDSIDMSVSNNVNDRYVQEYYRHLLNILQLYVGRYDMIRQLIKGVVTKEFNIQHYRPGGSFFRWHTERTSLAPTTLSRYLVFMTYLNDVTCEGGETEFYYQKLAVKPRKGLTLIWPTDWTHTHRGVPAVSQDKYIATGWLHLNA
jgi:uncharacterized protein YfaT (DUF1175 family)